MSRLAYSERILQPLGRFGTTFTPLYSPAVGKEERAGGGQAHPTSTIVARAFRKIHDFVPCREGEKASPGITPSQWKEQSGHSAPFSNFGKI